MDKTTFEMIMDHCLIEQGSNRLLITKTTKLECPECKTITLLLDWNDIELPCEDCGSHYGIECPKCGWLTDLTFQDFNKKEIEE